MTPEEVKRKADRAQARSKGIDPDSIDSTAEDATALSEGEINAEVKKLAALPIGVYESSRVENAKRLHMRASVLDILIKAEHDKTTKAGNDFLPHWKVEPWPDPVDGAALLDELQRYFNRYAVTPKHTDVVLALWPLHSWVFDCFDTTPYLAITSPTRRCGKSLVLTILQWICCRAKKNDSMSKAAIYRSVEAERPTLVLDETSWVIDLKDERQGILCGGFERNGFVEVCEGESANITVKRYSTYCPKAFGIIGKLTATLMDRSIEINMQRKMGREKVERLRRRDNDQHRVLRQKCLRWANDSRAALAAIEVQAPADLDDRAFDIWEPLLAIAQLAGGNWPKLAHDAATALSGERGANEGRSIELVHDICAELDRNKTPALKTKPLITALCADEERPWATYNNGKPITDRQLGGLLKPFHIISENIGPYGDRAKGYVRARFNDALERYPARSEAFLPFIRTNTDEMGTSSDFCIRSQIDVNGNEKCEKSADHGALYGCTDKNPQSDGKASNGGNGACEFPQVCVHCGAPATADAPVQLCAVDGKKFLLHRDCQTDWLNDLSIPPFLQRGSNND